LQTYWSENEFPELESRLYMLTIDIWDSIIKGLDRYDLISLRGVCRKLSDMLTSNNFWKRFYLKVICFRGYGNLQIDVLTDKMNIHSIYNISYEKNQVWCESCRCTLNCCHCNEFWSLTNIYMILSPKDEDKHSEYAAKLDRKFDSGEEAGFFKTMAVSAADRELNRLKRKLKLLVTKLEKRKKNEIKKKTEVDPLMQIIRASFIKKRERITEDITTEIKKCEELIKKTKSFRYNVIMKFPSNK
jgi:hypothetical protein